MESFRQSYPNTLRIGEWTIDSFLDSGATGEVYQVHRGEQIAAMKIFHPRHPEQRWQMLKAFARDRWFLRRQSLGTGMLKFYGSGTHTDGAPYVVMELAEALPCDSGGTRAHKLGLSSFTRICRSTGTVLATLHAQGFVHGDLKPSNILLVNGTAKLTDFGTVRRRRADGTFPTCRIGTEGFRAPEVEQYGEISISSDVFSFGKTMDALAGLIAERNYATVIKRASDSAVKSRIPSMPMLLEMFERSDDKFRKAISSLVILRKFKIKAVLVTCILLGILTGIVTILCHRGTRHQLDRELRLLRSNGPTAARLTADSAATNNIRHWLEVAVATTDQARDWSRQGQAAYAAKDYRMAVQLLEKAIRTAGYTNAADEVILAECYRHGRGVPSPNPRRAKQLATAAQDHAAPHSPEAIKAQAILNRLSNFSIP